MLYVRDTGTDRGRGVFTAAKIAAGALIEACPVVVLDARETALVEETTLNDYYYYWGINNDLAAIVLGYGMLYNHSYTPNAYYYRDLQNRILNYVALREILPGEEITINYNGDPADQQHFQLTKREDADS